MLIIIWHCRVATIFLLFLKMQSLQSTIKSNKTRSASTENVDCPHKVVQESLVMKELEKKKKRLRKRRRCSLASMHVWDVSTLTHNHWSIRQASLGNKSGAGSEGNRVSQLVIQLIFMECPQRPRDYSRHLRCKDKQVSFIIQWSEPKPKQLSRGLVMCLAYSFPGLVPWNTLTFLTLSASMSNLSPGWLNMNKQCRAIARKLMEAPSAWIEVSWTSSLCLVSLQLGGWFQISGPCLSGNRDRRGLVQGAWPDRGGDLNMSYPALWNELEVLQVLLQVRGARDLRAFPGCPSAFVLHHSPQRMMPLVQATCYCHPLWSKQKHCSPSRVSSTPCHTSMFALLNSYHLSGCTVSSCVWG